jgi:hypothetical protein
VRSRNQVGAILLLILLLGLLLALLALDALARRAAPKQDVVFRVVGTTERGIYMQPMTTPQFTFTGPAVEKGTVLLCDTEIFRKSVVQDNVTFTYPVLAMTCEGQRYEMKGISFSGKEY